MQRYPTQCFAMTKKVRAKQFSGEIPDTITEAFDARVEKLGFIKKRAIAAAIWAFAEMDEDEAFGWYRRVYAGHYRDKADNLTADEQSARAAQRALQDTAGAQLDAAVPPRGRSGGGRASRKGADGA